MVKSRPQPSEKFDEVPLHLRLADDISGAILKSLFDSALIVQIYKVTDF